MEPNLEATTANDDVDDVDGVDLAAEDLIEEVSIDGMCGVY